MHQMPGLVLLLTMAMYQVKWHADPRDPRSSCWYTLNGVVTYASALLKEWEGGDHKALVRYLHRRGYSITQLDPTLCVPPTKTYHHQLLSCVGALLELLNQEK